MKKFYITTPIYYASDRPHIGHAFAAVYADVISRFFKAGGREVFLSVGTDEHGAKIERIASEKNKEPREYVEEISGVYREAWRNLNVEYSDFIRTTEERHKKGVECFIEKLKNSGDIYKSKYEGLYCVGCEKFLKEKDLIDGFCSDHRRPPEKIEETNYFFNLRKYLPQIRRLIESGELIIIPESRKNEAIGFIEQGIDDFSISREKVRWGIPYPGDESQTVYVWVEALINYLTVLDYPEGEKLNMFWPPDLHIIGAEINKFHTIFWPALLLAVGLSLPKRIFIHGLFTVDGKKMSKTLGNVIEPFGLIEKFGADAVRYLLISQFPASEHGDIAESRFVEKYNADLANGIGNLFERTLALAAKSGADFKNCRLADSSIELFCSESENDYLKKMENYQLFESLAAVFSFAKKLDQYINQTEPWNLFKSGENEKYAENVGNVVFGIRKIILWLKPFMPLKMDLAEAAFKKIGFDSAKLNLFPRL